MEAVLQESSTQVETKKVFTLKGHSPSDDVGKLVAAWGKKVGAKVHGHRFIRQIDRDFSVEVRFTMLPSIDESEELPERSPFGYDLENDKHLSPFAMATLKSRYLLPTETSPQQAFFRASRAFADDQAHAQRLYSYVTRQWFMFATPLTTNAPNRDSWSEKFEENFQPGMYSGAKRGLPISCFLNSVQDSRNGLNEHYAENALLSSMGGGIGSYWGHIRTNGIKTSSGSQSSGAIPFMAIMDRYVLAFAQGTTRRASYAMYMDISHPEIIEFLDIRKPSGGDANRRTLNLHNAVNIPDSFMEIIEACMTDPDADDSWPLIDPHSNAVTETVSAKLLWQRIIELRMQTGEPYIHWIDASNRALPKAQREAGLRVYCSNLCTEITLATDKLRTAVCCLSSVNLEKADEWMKDENFISDLVRMLDNTLEYFINHACIIKPEDAAQLRADLKADPALAELNPTPEIIEAFASYIERHYLAGMKKAVYSAKMERSIGLGAMGFHSYLQSRNQPFEGAMASSINRQLYAHIKRHAEKATVQLAVERGACPDAMGEMRRNMHLLAPAPNATSAILINTSPSNEASAANAYTQKTAEGSWLVKNRYLEKVLEKYGRNDADTWSYIITNKGSVQGLDFLTQWELDVFKTAPEIDQQWVIDHAATRQPEICQSQSTNLFFPANAHVKYLHTVHFQAWKKGLKTLYYCRSEASKQAEAVSQKIAAAPISTESTCLACEG